MQSWGLTDPGCVREQNQDSYQIEQLDKHTVLCVICDGMGGAKSGNVASSLAVDVFTQEIKQSWHPDMDAERLDQMLSGAVKLANFTVYDQAQQFEEFNGMGTTLVAVLIQGKQATFVNVGDSRAYCVDKNGIVQVTTDHSLVQLMVARGELTREQARRYPGKNLITRAVGTREAVSGDICTLPWREGDRLLLCSDGLYSMVEERELCEILAEDHIPAHTVHVLISAANTHGGEDNVTALVVENKKEISSDA